MKFKKYNSIENSYQERFKSVVVNERADDKDSWFVTEKIHGANFSVLTDGVDIKFAKRSGFLNEGENFHNWHEIANDLSKKVLKLYDVIKNRYDDTFKVQVFGELFGGSYPHKDINKNNHATRVQKGVFYSPNNEFMAFDILVNDERYLYPKEAFELFKICAIHHVPVVATGLSLDEALKVSNEFQTLVPSLLGLPEIPDNVCEGVVISPEAGKRFTNGGNRIIFKNKNSKFSEKQKTKVKKQSLELSESEKEWQNNLCGYINDNRLDNVVSHEGSFESIKQMGKFMGLMQQDVMKDFIKDNPEYLLLEQVERTRVEKVVAPAIVTLLKGRL